MSTTSSRERGFISGSQRLDHSHDVQRPDNEEPRAAVASDNPRRTTSCTGLPITV